MNPTVFLPDEDLFAIYAMMDIDNEGEAGDSLESVQWVEHGHINDKDITLLTSL